MFSAELVHYDEFAPSGKECRDTCISGVQTEPVATREMDVQGYRCSDAEVQASPEVVAVVEPRAYDWPSLATFMRQAYPRMKQELGRASRSSAFHGYRLLADTREGGASRLYRYTAFPGELHCTDASWNATGSIVAFSASSTCGFANHEEWCTHEAGVRLWNPHRSSSSDEAEKLLSTDACVTSVAFHPLKPSVVVAGTVHGDVLMWDVEASNEQQSSFQAVIMRENHQDTVRGMEWIGDEPHCLLSCGLDGLIIQWRREARKNQLDDIRYFLLLAENVRLHKKPVSGATTAYIGVTCLAKNHFDHSVFVMGTEGGGVLQGSLSLSKPIAPAVDGHASAGRRTYSCPVVASFPPHRGHTLDIHSSPFERNVFASAGIDREVKVFSLLQMEAVLTVQLPEPATKVRWSPSRPTLFAALHGDGRLSFYDLRSTTAPVAEFAPDAPNAVGTSLEFCTGSRDLVFAGRGPGAAQVWQLGSKLVAATEANQGDLIRSVANGSFVTD